jgi:prepilin-type N-terminal cleavage/methylation domain-containing protein
MTRCALNHAAIERRAGRAFTLVEMLVSLAVLAVALGMVGVVFNVTVQTTRQAAAYSEAQNLTQQFINQIEEDLRHCDPSSSVLVLVGRTQAAARTKADLDARKFWRVPAGDPSLPISYDPQYDPLPSAGTVSHSDPRGDILMFFTNRPMTSQAPPAAPTAGSFADDCLHGMKYSPIEVVYGHAALDDATATGYGANLKHIEQNKPGAGTGPAALSKLSLTEWHLSRRATILRDPASAGVFTLVVDDTGFARTGAGASIARCQWYNDGYEDMPGDAARFSLPALLDALSPNRALIGSSLPQALESPYVYPTNWDLDVVKSINSLLYTSGRVDPPSPYHHVATVVENPPPELASNAGVQMLPGCAWFQVEFLMPEDPRNSLEYNDPTPLIAADYSERRDMPRWTEVNADTTKGSTTYVFVPDTPANRNLVAQQLTPGVGAPTGRLLDFARLDQNVSMHNSPTDAVSSRIIRMWPYAIRITVRVFDRQGRLNEPIVRSIVHRFD